MKILIVKLGALGDVINTFPAVIRLKKHFNAEIHWLVAPLSYPLVKNHPCVDRAILFDKNKKHGLILEINFIIRAIREEYYDLVLDFQRTLKSGFFCLMSKSRKKIGFDKKRCKELTWLYPFTRIPPSDPGKHMLEQYLDFTDYLGIKSDIISWGITLTDCKADSIHDCMGKKLPDRYIILNIGATKKANLWPAWNFSELAKLLYQKTKIISILTGGGREDIKQADLITETAGRSVVNMVGKTSINELVKIISNAMAVVSCDTGPMHLSVALGKKTIGLFGPSDPVRTGPYRGEVIRKSISCSPCNRKKCPDPLCMKMITPHDVLLKISELLQQP